MSWRNLFKLFVGKGNLCKNVARGVTLARDQSSETLRLCHKTSPLKQPFLPKRTGLVIGLSVLGWLGFQDEDKDQESELIMTLKRAVLCTRREQFETAEQMLHLALRLAQQQHNHHGVLYCYDLMANLAMDTFKLDKAEKLFVSVLQMLLGHGTEQNDLKVIHVSLKLARISQLKADVEKADIGYKWCLEQIDKQKNDSEDAQILCGIVHDWYSQFLLDKGEVSNALFHLKKAYDVCKQTTGHASEQSMLLLNDLGTTSFRAGDQDGAQNYLKEAISVGRDLEDKTHLGVVHANLGLILLEKGVTNEAEKYCKEAWQLGKRHESNESVEQANYCLDQIKLVLGT